MSQSIFGKAPISRKSMLQFHQLMAEKILQCTPNFSEGRRLQVVDEIVEAISGIPQAMLLDRSSSADHNRSVLTFAGPPDAVIAAAFAATRRASQLIDMTKHQGEHPRIGATDVIPFTPLVGTTMEDCIHVARTTAKRVGTELRIPVYLYEKAATQPHRKNLAAIRRGEYEGICESIASDPKRAPDFGPRDIGTAGATAIGARNPLIAFNVYLTTSDIEIARKIARNIRYSSGGMPNVKALGMLVEERAQVSMNLTDYTRTPVHQVVQKIRLEAAGHGVSIHHSEVVGLLPKAALVDSSQWHLKPDEAMNRILETRLSSAST